MSIVSMLQELTRGETWGNKEQFERNYYEGKKVLDDLEMSDDVPFQYYDNGQSVNIYITDDVNLEITFVYNEEDGWCHYCDLVYQSDDSSFDMLSGHGIDSILNVTDTVMDLCRDY